MTEATKPPDGLIEEALLFMAARCDCATSEDGQGFNKEDAPICKDYASRIEGGEKLKPREKKDALQRLKKYKKTQLPEGGFDFDELRAELGTEPKVEIFPKPPEVPADIKKEAWKVLQYGNPLQRRISYIIKGVSGESNEKAAKVATFSCHSAYLQDRVHNDINGPPTKGKTALTIRTLNTFPPENVIFATEVSPKSAYYLSENVENFDDTILYIDDARTEHIPILKVLRNDSEIQPLNITVSEGKALVLRIKGRPATLASSVQPLTDLEGQAVTRAFMTTIMDAPSDEEMKIRKTIRQRRRVGTLIKTGEDREKLVLQEMARITRDEGIRSVVVPFDAIEPASADRRGTGQFISLIEISAFINQFQRPVLEMKDGSKHILATFDDFRDAAELWFSFHEAQEFKIPAKAIELLKEVPTEERSLKKCSVIAGRQGVRDKIGPQTTVEHYMETLFDRGLVYRERISAPGSPWGYWTDKEIREKVMDFGKKAGSERSEASDIEIDLGTIRKDSSLAKYMAENSSDCLISSIYEFFTNQDLVQRNTIERILGVDRPSLHQCAIGSYLSQIVKEVPNGDNASLDSEYSRKTDNFEITPNEATTSTDIASLGNGQTAQRALDVLRCEALQEVLGG